MEAAFDAAERAGRLLMEAFMWRYHPQTERLVRLVRDGAVGELRVVRAAFGFDLAAGLQRALVGGARGRRADGRRLLLRQRACGCWPASRCACRPSRSTGGEDVDARFAGVLRFDGDVLGTFDCGFDVADRGAHRGRGRGGHDRLRRPVARPRRPTCGCCGPTREPERDRGDRRRTRTRSSSTTSRAAVRGGGAPRLGRADAVGQARAIEALYAAAGSGTTVAV